MIRNVVLALFFVILAPVFSRAETPLLHRGSISGREFSEIGTLYLEKDQKIHFRSDSKLYFFSHMYFIADALKKSGVASDGKIIYSHPIRITGNYSKASAGYDFQEEPPLRGQQIVWIDKIEKVSTPAERTKKSRSLFSGKDLDNWSVLQQSKDAPSAWTVRDGAITHSMSPGSFDQRLMSEASYRDFELSFEYRSSWGTSASLMIRANDQGEAIGLSLDHADGGHVGMPKSLGGSCSPFSLYETRIKIGFGKTERDRLQYDGRSQTDGVAQSQLLEICTLHEFLKEWDGAYWNVVKVRCVGANPIVTVWVNGFLICRFHAAAVSMHQKNPAHIGGIKKYTVNPEGHIGFIVHSAPSEEPQFLLREIRLKSQ